MKTTMFLTYPKRCLVPTIKRGDIVIMNNLPVHEGPRAGSSGRDAASFHPYSPGLNPGSSRPSANGRLTQGS